MNMFDEITEVQVVNGKPLISDEQQVEELDAKDMQEAVEDFVLSAKNFNSLNTPGACHNKWWQFLECLALADSRLKRYFCGGHFSRENIRLYQEYRIALIAGRKLPGAS